MASVARAARTGEAARARPKAASGRPFVTFAICAAGLFQSPVALAQSTAPTREELEAPRTVPAPVAGGVSVDRVARFRQPCPFDGSPLTVSLAHVRFTAASSRQLPPELARSLSGLSVPQGERPVSVVCEIRDAATAALRRDGWLASVQIPQQELADTLELSVVSGRISEVRVTGDVGPYAELVTRRLGELQALYPLNERDAERILLETGDIPGLSVRLSLAPDPGSAGDLIGNVNASFHRFAMLANANNANSRRVGRESVFGRLEYFGLTGLADRTYLGAQTTLDFAEQRVVQAGHGFALGTGNVRLGANLTLGWSRPAVAGLDIRTRSVIASVEATRPLTRSVDSRADLAVGLDVIDQRTTVGPVPLSSDAIRAVYSRATFSGQQRGLDGSVWLSLDGYVEARRGLGILGATRTVAGGLAQTYVVSASRPFGDASATIVRAGADVSASLARIFGLRARSEAQWADKPLLNYDEYAVGNLSIGRGYDPGANAGDRAVGASFEASALIHQSPKNGAQLFGFYDVVRVENLDFGTVDRRQTLASLGGGLRLSLGSNLRAEVTYAHPLDRALTGDPRRPPDRLLLSFTARSPA